MMTTVPVLSPSSLAPWRGPTPSMRLRAADGLVAAGCKQKTCWRVGGVRHDGIQINLGSSSWSSRAAVVEQVGALATDGCACVGAFGGLDPAPRGRRPLHRREDGRQAPRRPGEAW